MEIKCWCGEDCVKFNKAIEEGRLSKNPYNKNFVGFYMYMGMNNGKAQFKHIETREYIK